MRDNKSRSNVQKLEELGVLTKTAVKRRNDDIGKYLKEKVEKDEEIIRELIQIFKKNNPSTIVSFPVSFDRLF